MNECSKLFISHSTHDDAFVRNLRQALDEFDQPGWIDSRELRGGDLLWDEIRKAIDAATAYALVVSPAALQSASVGKELQYALSVQKERGKDHYRVIPLSLDGTKLGVVEALFSEEPLYIPVSSQAGGIEAAVHPILVALGKRLPADLSASPQPQAEALEDLVLELTDLKFHAGLASARARLIYEPATAGQPRVSSVKSWRFVAPLGPIETSELRWYLEKYAIWPSGVFRDRARKVEKQLVAWGKLLHDAALPLAHTANVSQAWARIDAHAGRRFSVHVDALPEDGAAETEVQAAREVATLLLALPWELLHDGNAFLFQGAKPTRVRRRLPNTDVLDVPVLATPIRILLVSPRPEDDSCGYIDHRASALPLVVALEALGGIAQVHVLAPATLPALSGELERAGRIGAPYHVVHFNGHGVYDREEGGGLCFEDPQDSDRLARRRHQTVFTKDLGPLLKDHRIPLVFLEACQSAQAGPASESVASDLLKRGVASVIAMSHSVLVETSRRFVQAFYGALVGGARVGGAMLAGQRALKDDSFRGSIFGAGELRLADWFVPVLFQEKDDPQLFRNTPGLQTGEDLQRLLARRLGEVPEPPETGFIGRSRDLLALERLLGQEHYAVLRGQGGEGKTALAAELARWLVRSQRFHRAAFVSLETHGNATALIDSIGRQLVGNSYSAAAFETLESALLPVERELAEQATIVVVDNLESVLLPPYLQEETPQALGDEARRELDAILALCARLNACGQTRIIFTSREALPAPFAGDKQRRELDRLETDDAVKLVERALNRPGEKSGAAGDSAREAIEQLVAAVNCHARTLALIAPSLRERGVEHTRAALVELMAEMAREFPAGHPKARERSLFASVELSLRRMSEVNRDRARVLGVFHGGVGLAVLIVMMKWEVAEAASLARELIATGLATANRHEHLTFNPALCPYLQARLDVAEREVLSERWAEAMRGYVGFLCEESKQNAKLTATLTAIDLPNLFTLLEMVQRAGDSAATIALATSLYRLLQNAGKPRLLKRLAQIRDAALAALGEDWNHSRVDAEQNRIERALAGGLLPEALCAAEALLESCRAAGEHSYPDVDYDLAMACFLLARVLNASGASELALPLLEEARQRLETIAKARASKPAEGMASVCLAEQGDCLRRLGRLGEAVAAYEESISRAERLGDERSVAVGKGQLGFIRLDQHRYPEALAAFAEARESFSRLKEPGSVATSWRLIGIVYQQTGHPDAAEDAYRKSLAIQVRLGDVGGQAGTLGELGNLYDGLFDRPEDATVFYRQAADKYFEMGDAAKEGSGRNNLANTLRKLGRLDEARIEINRAIACIEPFGHACSPWTTWNNLADIETDSGNWSAAAQAKQKAVAAYLAYRRAGGENHYNAGRLSLSVSERLIAGDRSAAVAMIDHIDADPELPDFARPFVECLRAITAGSRDRHLADSPELHYTMAAEILFLIETLEERGA